MKTNLMFPFGVALCALLLSGCALDEVYVRHEETIRSERKHRLEGFEVRAKSLDAIHLHLEWRYQVPGSVMEIYEETNLMSQESVKLGETHREFFPIPCRPGVYRLFEKTEVGVYDSGHIVVDAGNCLHNPQQVQVHSYRWGTTVSWRSVPVAEYYRITVRSSYDKLLFLAEVIPTESTSYDVRIPCGMEAELQIEAIRDDRASTLATEPWHLIPARVCE